MVGKGKRGRRTFTMISNVISGTIEIFCMPIMQTPASLM